MVEKTRDDETLNVVRRRIEAYTNAHTESLQELQSSAKLRSGEAESLEAFNGFLGLLLEKFDTLVSPSPKPPTGPRKPLAVPASRLLLNDCYQDIDIAAVHYLVAETYDGTVKRTPEAQWRTLFAALLAAEVEINGKFRLRRGDTARIAKILETVGTGFRNSDLPLHAAYAFDRAADQYRSLRDIRAEHACLLEEIRARHVARPNGLRKAVEFCADQLSGYGYLPYRMLRWIVLQLALFTGILWLATPDQVGPVKALESVLLDYLNPTGPDPGMRGLGNALLVADSYSGYMTLTIFFALLVRRW